MHHKILQTLEEIYNLMRHPMFCIGRILQDSHEEIPKPLISVKDGGQATFHGCNNRRWLAEHGSGQEFKQPACGINTLRGASKVDGIMEFCVA